MAHSLAWRLAKFVGLLDDNGDPPPIEPIAHKTTHAIGGTDVLTPADIGASATAHAHAHSALTGVTADQHHAQAHVLAGSDHTASGLTAGHVLRATAATTFAFGAIADADLPSTITRDSEAAAAYSAIGHGHTLDFGETGDIVASAFGDTAAAGATGEIADAGHRHAREANPVTAHEAAGDPHPTYLTAAEGNAAYQPVDSDLTAIAALSTTSFGRGLLALADAAALAANHSHGGGAGSDPPQGSYAPGSFTVPTGKFALSVTRLILTGSQRATLQGTARMKVMN